MKLSVINLHKAFESRIRLGIMSALAVNNMLDFSLLRAYLNVTDGNLASHLKALEKEMFIDEKKSITGGKSTTKYFLTKKGKNAFDSHLKALAKIIRKVAE